mmetsp:Transcript_44370/g.118633  ORF Transcript_44370/g.118633 Transcript_44370/m.118633 type:complete len:401 (+) Transcript_44370:649-1851(+)
MLGLLPLLDEPRLQLPDVLPHPLDLGILLFQLFQRLLVLPLQLLKAQVLLCYRLHLLQQFLFFSFELLHRQFPLFDLIEQALHPFLKCSDLRPLFRERLLVHFFHLVQLTRVFFNDDLGRLRLLLVSPGFVFERPPCSEHPQERHAISLGAIVMLSLQLPSGVRVLLSQPPTCPIGLRAVCWSSGRLGRLTVVILGNTHRVLLAFGAKRRARQCEVTGQRAGRQHPTHLGTRHAILPCIGLDRWECSRRVVAEHVSGHRLPRPQHHRLQKAVVEHGMVKPMVVHFALRIHHFLLDLLFSGPGRLQLQLDFPALRLLLCQDFLEFLSLFGTLDHLLGEVQHRQSGRRLVLRTHLGLLGELLALIWADVLRLLLGHRERLARSFAGHLIKRINGPILRRFHR